MTSAAWASTKHLDILERVAPFVDGDAHVTAARPERGSQRGEGANLRITAPRVDDVLDTNGKWPGGFAETREIAGDPVDIAVERQTDGAVHIEVQPRRVIGPRAQA